MRKAYLSKSFINLIVTNWEKVVHHSQSLGDMPLFDQDSVDYANSTGM